MSKVEAGLQLGHPKKSFSGALINKFLTHQNAFLEKCAVKLANISPDHTVLELGFGPGVGLRCAYWRVAEGRGKIYGIDRSSYMVEKASKYCALEISEDKIEISRGLVSHLPYMNNFFDRVFHCNCFYFWPDLVLTSREILRVMKPGALMVTTMYADSLKRLESEGILKKDIFINTDPLDYMHALEEAGFTNVHVKYFTYKDKVYQGMFATKPSEQNALPIEEQERILKERIESDLLRRSPEKLEREIKKEAKDE